ncbi:MAG: hypothetical protein IJK25_02955, partial [Firmicutes bacterium]|nr:hypothetical protein [Bacillota bacterium]
CGKCRIRVLSDCPNCPEEAAFFTKKELADGCAVLSLADPVATADILGPVTFRETYMPHLVRLIERLKGLPQRPLIHLCGKLTQSLIDAEGAKVQALRLDCRTYGEAIRLYRNWEDPGVVGHFCVHRLKEERPVVSVLRLD